MKVTMQEALTTLDERTLSLKANRSQSQDQRRNIVVDNFGSEFSRQGDANHPAEFFISISNDLVYFERYQFKIVISPFVQPVKGNGATGNTTLTLGRETLTTTGTAITPNPHSHTITGNPHNHPLEPGISISDGTATEFEIYIENINVTDYLRAQWKGKWITGQGIYPNGKTLDAYDLLAIESYLPRYNGSHAIYTPGYKKFEVRGNGTFNCVLYLYLKYSFVNR